jgi:AAA domain
MNSPSRFPGGSIWRKWDLHIHSPLSILNNQFPHNPDGAPNWDLYISKLEELDVAVVGITDYFTIDGYKKVRDFKNAGRLPNIDRILPNIEFRLKTIISSRRDGKDAEEIRLNFHVIFSDEIPDRDIEEHFLHDIPFYFQGDPQNPVEKRKLKVSNLEELGKELLRQHEQFRKMNLSALEVGAMQAVVDPEEIIELLTRDSRFRGKYLVVLPAVGWDDINWDGQAHLVRKALLRYSDMVLSSSSSTRQWCLGIGPYKDGAEKFKEEFATLKPCVHGSDAHDLLNIGNHCKLRGEAGHVCQEQPRECDQRYCWIKADPTFEGLKQLLYEPGARVAIQGKNPTPLKSNSCIAGFRANGGSVNEELSLELTNLPFNSGLVAITGGKGAGKTALVDLLANSFRDRCNTKDSNSFVRRIVGDGANLLTSITFGDGALFEKKLTDSRFVEQSEAVYIAQGELELYIGEASDLDKYIRGLIFESREVKNTVIAFEFEKLIRTCRDFEKEIAQKSDSIEKLENQSTGTVLTAVTREKAQVEAELRDVNSKIPDLESRLTKEKVEIVQNKQAARSMIKARKDRLIELSDLLTTAKHFVRDDVARFNLHTVEINNLIRELHIQTSSLPILEYTALRDLETLQESVDAELNLAVSEIEQSEKELSGYESEMREHALYLNRKNELAAKLVTINQKLETITADTQRLNEARQAREALFRELLRTALMQQQKYSEIIKLFASNKAQVLSDLDFSAQIQFDRTGLLKGLVDVLDNRQVQVMGDDAVPSRFEKLQSLYRSVSLGDAVAIEELIAETRSLCDEMKTKIKGSRGISPGSLYRCFYGTYLSIIPVVTYKRTALSKLSLGQKATVLIKIYLAQGTNPIMIDSHDDHLDNEFIMDELVGAIREAKGYRQVILASNNGNVVINSDAEQIIVAQREQGKISYISGSIENPVIRERALCVLEGGADAFKKRQQKYRLES